ncbi:MAG TPA: family 43 glycosylhydrolase [Acidobacteriota bacterium]|nr:family 43 glycosylhydrolase [Acidobacteriota bacterium]
MEIRPSSYVLSKSLLVGIVGLLIAPPTVGSWAGAPSSVQMSQGDADGVEEARSREPRRYVNPLVMEKAGRLADPTVIVFRGNYYLYLTGGVSPGGRAGAGVWSSEDLVSWVHHQVDIPDGRGISAPTAFAYEGYVYLTGNDSGLFRSRDPLGPFEFFGDFVDQEGRRLARDLCAGCEDGGVFDPAVFIDDDDHVYLYYAGGGRDGVYGVELDRNDLRRWAGPYEHFFRFEPSHIWERYGSRNEMSAESWIEGPWMTKHDGTYYLQYAAPGTDWITYGVGVYTSDKPLGPFTYYEGSPVLVHQGGLINGSGHHSVVEGPEGGLWAIYTLLYRNWNRMFERRIGMDPVGFDAQGNMVFNGPSETPQWAPGVVDSAWEDNGSGSMPLSQDKNYVVSSEAPGRNAPYALDNNARTWWVPAADDGEPWLEIDLAAGWSQDYVVDSARILFALPEGDVEDESSPDNRGLASRIRQYKIEVSLDGDTFTTVVDKTGNDRDNAVEFDEIVPVECRYVRLTITGWPSGLRPGVLEFTVFGRPIPSPGLPRP